MKHQCRVNIVGMAVENSHDEGPQSVDYAFARTLFGEVAVAATESGVCALLFDNDAAALGRLKAMFPHAALTERLTRPMERALEAVNDGKSDAKSNAERGADITLHLKGTLFQLAVWRALVEIPWGTTATYSDIAAAVGHPRALRAVGSAVGANPVAIVIPCHRVVPRAGGTGNYRWGARLKAELLNHETTKYGLENKI